MTYRSRIFKRSSAGGTSSKRRSIAKRLTEKGYSSKTKKDATFIDNNVQDIQYFIRTHYISDKES